MTNGKIKNQFQVLAQCFIMFSGNINRCECWPNEISDGQSTGDPGSELTDFGFDYLQDFQKRLLFAGNLLQLDRVIAGRLRVFSAAFELSDSRCWWVQKNGDHSLPCIQYTRYSRSWIRSIAAIESQHYFTIRFRWFRSLRPSKSHPACCVVFDCFC